MGRFALRRNEYDPAAQSGTRTRADACYDAQDKVWCSLLRATVGSSLRSTQSRRACRSPSSDLWSHNGDRVGCGHLVVCNRRYKLQYLVLLSNEHAIVVPPVRRFVNTTDGSQVVTARNSHQTQPWLGVRGAQHSRCATRSTNPIFSGSDVQPEKAHDVCGLTAPMKTMIGWLNDLTGRRKLCSLPYAPWETSCSVDESPSRRPWWRHCCRQKYCY